MDLRVHAMRTRVAGVFQALERVTGHDITLMRAVGGPASAPEFIMGMSSTLGSLPARLIGHGRGTEESSSAGGDTPQISFLLTSEAAMMH